MATPKTPRKRAATTDTTGDVPPETQAETPAPAFGQQEIVDAEVILDTPAEVPAKVAERPATEESSDAPEPVADVAGVAPVDPEAMAETPVSEAEAEAEAAWQPPPPDKDEAPAAEATVPGPEAQGAEQKHQAPADPVRESGDPARAGGAAAPARRRPVFVPLVLGGVVAAGIGFGLARFVQPDGWPIARDTTATAAIAALEARQAENASDIADMKSRLEALALAGPEDTLSGDLALLGDTAANALETANNAQHAFDSLAPRLSAIEAKLAALETRPTGIPTVDSAVIDRLSADVDSMRAEVEAQKAAADAAAARLAAEVELARAAAEARAQTTLLQAAVARVQAALQSGAPFADPLAQLAAAGITIPAPLPELSADGAPTVLALRDSFGEAARAALDVARRENVGTSVTDRLSSFLQTQTGARSLTPREGDDADAVLSRAEEALRLGDLPGALGLVAALPASARDAMAGWVAQANTLLAAQDAAKTLSAALSER